MSDLHELSIERIIDAPIDAVWRAWTEHLPDWFCPRPWTTELIEQDLRPGGRSAMVMHGPAGERHEIESVVLEVVAEKRIVTTDAFAHGWKPRGPFMVRIDTFEDAGASEHGSRTRYTATARHWTAEAKTQQEAMGFEGGWGVCADQLAEVAKRLAG